MIPNDTIHINFRVHYSQSSIGLSQMWQLPNFYRWLGRTPYMVTASRLIASEGNNWLQMKNQFYNYNCCQKTIAIFMFTSRSHVMQLITTIYEMIKIHRVKSSICVGFWFSVACSIHDDKWSPRVLVHKTQESWRRLYTSSVATDLSKKKSIANFAFVRRSIETAGCQDHHFMSVFGSR